MARAPRWVTGMDLPTLCHACTQALIAGQRVTLSLPLGKTWPRGWPRGELLSVGTDGHRNVSYDPLRVLAWVQRATQAAQTILPDFAPGNGTRVGVLPGSGPLRLRVNSPRHSLCAMDLDALDWSRWWTDGTQGGLYLHVAGPNDTWQRVYCRQSETPRLRFEGGELWWLVDLGPNARLSGAPR